MGGRRAIEPPEQGFYGWEQRVSGVRIVAHRSVRRRAMDEAARRVRTLLAGCPAVRANLRRAEVELHVIAEHHAVTDLPMYRAQKGIPFDGALTMDERGRGYGGLHACTAEESLLRLPTARHADHRDVCTHELAHAVLDFGLDPDLRDAVDARYEEVRAAGLWDGLYASTNAHELFAELSMWWVGSHGDGVQRVPPGRDALRAHDPVGCALLDDVYGGRRVPSPVRWVGLAPTDGERSAPGDVPTRLVVCNRTEGPVALVWLAHDGRRVPYATVAPGAVCVQRTWVGHLWSVEDPRGSVLARGVCGRDPTRVTLTAAAGG